MLVQLAQPKYTEDELFDASVKTFYEGVRRLNATEKERELAAAREAMGYRGVRGTNPVTKNMRHVAEIPATEFFNLVRKYGHDEVHSKGFIKHLQKTHPHLATSKV